MKKKVNIVVLKDTTTSAKGNLTTLCKVEQVKHGMVVELASGFIKTMAQFKQGETIVKNAMIDGIATRLSANPDADGTPFTWLIPSFVEEEETAE